MRTDHVIQFSVSPDLNLYSPDANSCAREKDSRSGGGAAGRSLGERFANGAFLPGTARVRTWWRKVTFRRNTEDTHVDEDWIGENFFSTMGIPLLSGREFTASDTATSPKVAIVSEGIARRFFGGRNPVGMHIGIGAKQDKNHPDIEIVGFVKDSKTADVHEKLRPMVYLPYTQDPALGSVTFFARTGQDPDALR